MQFGADIYGGSPSPTSALEGNACKIEVFNGTLTSGEQAEVKNGNLPLDYDLYSAGLKSKGLLSWDANSNDDTLTDKSGNSEAGTNNGAVATGDQIDWQE